MDKLEAVARAIYEKDRQNGVRLQSWSRASELDRRYAIAAARAAMSAMYEPTEEMLQAGCKVEIELDNTVIAAWARWREDFLTKKWQAMIDVELSL